jgi:chloramphenicol-sensitive protein RarD
MSEKHTLPPHETAGIFYAIGSYGLWGVLPLYWHMLGTVPPFELSYHRMVWSAVVGVIATLLLGRRREVWAAVRNRKVILALTLSSVFIAFNWTLYIYAIAKAELVEASLGYYINPLICVAIGVALLGEKLSVMRLVAIGLAGVAVLFKALTLGHFPFIALGLAVSFAIYGYIRKLTPVAALDGFTIETCLLLPFTGGILAFWGFEGTGAFTPAHPGTDILLILGGPLTALPLILFAAAARRVSLSMLGFLQYLSPSISLVIAIFVLGEPFTQTDLMAFGCVWVALVLVALDGRVRRPVKT